MKNLLTFVCSLVIVFATSCASTDYATFEGGKIIQGTGGTKKLVDGMEIWTNGSPPRKFRIIGIIDDARRQALIPMASYEADLVKKAKEAGGNAIVILDARSDVVGYRNSGESGTAQTSGTVTGGYYQGQTTYQSHGSSTRAVRDKITKAAVIRFED